MNTIGIFTGSTEKGIKKFKEYLDMFSSKENVKYARIRYTTSRLPSPCAHPFEYPLCVFTTDDIVIGLADVTAGYCGEGPRGMVELLKYLGFSFDENEILSQRKAVKLDILKEDVKLKKGFEQYFLLEHQYLVSPFEKAE